MMQFPIMKRILYVLMALVAIAVSCKKEHRAGPQKNNTPLTLEVAKEAAVMKVVFTSTLSRDVDIQYSLDDGRSWITLTIPEGKPQYTDAFSVQHKKEPGRDSLMGVTRVQFKANNESYGEYSSVGLDNSPVEIDRGLVIRVDEDCYIYGNIMSLVAGDKFAKRTDLKESRTFFNLFSGNDSRPGLACEEIGRQVL